MGKGEEGPTVFRRRQFCFEGPSPYDVGGEKAWEGVWAGPPRPDRVPDILGNFLKALKGEINPWRGESTRQPYPGPPPSELFLLLPNVTPPKAGFSKSP